MTKQIYSVGNNSSKLEMEIIPLDPVRVELIKEILKQNALILDFVCYTLPENVVINNISELKEDINRSFRNLR